MRDSALGLSCDLILLPYPQRPIRLRPRPGDQVGKAIGNVANTPRSAHFPGLPTMPKSEHFGLTSCSGYSFGGRPLLEVRLVLLAPLATLVRSDWICRTVVTILMTSA